MPRTHDERPLSSHQRRGPMPDGDVRRSGVTARDLRDVLCDAPFPTGRDTLLETARDHGAPGPMLDFIETLEARRYDSLDDVIDTVMRDFSTRSAEPDEEPRRVSAIERAPGEVRVTGDDNPDGDPPHVRPQ